MKVLLIAPKEKKSSYYRFSRWDDIGLGLFYLVSSLKKNGFEVKLVLIGSTDVATVLMRFKPDIVGITCVTASYNLAIRILESVKSHDKSIITVIGGHHVTFSARDTLGEGCVDYVVRGEGEEVFPLLLKNIMKKKPYEIIPGVCFKRGKRIYNLNSMALVKDINEIPFPDRGAAEDYNFPGVYMLASRGCPFKCNFCSASNFYRGIWRKRSVQNILDELEGIEGIRNDKITVQFGDESLTLDIRWLKELCKGIIDRGFKFKWYSNSRADSIDRAPEVLELLKEAGCKGLSLGIESGVQEIIDSFNKGITTEQALRVAKKIRDIAIYQQWYLMIGSGDKYDRLEIIRKNVEFMKKFPFDLLQISILTPFPGTELYDQLKKEGRIIQKNWDYYDGLHCVYEPVGITAEHLEEEMTRAYREIYFHSGTLNLLRRILRFRHTLANTRGFLTFITLIIKVGILKQDMRTALK